MSTENEIKDSVTASIHWLGAPMTEVYRNIDKFGLQHVASVSETDNHTVLYELPIIDELDNQPPQPRKGEPKWDNLHVRLPFSAESLCPTDKKEENESSSTIFRWELIKETLSQPINNIEELQEAILVYNSEFKESWNFKALHKLFESDFDEKERELFFNDLLPRIIRLALQLPELIQAPIPLLKQNRSHSLTLSQQQVSSLLANAFLCTFPHRNTIKRRAVDPEYKTFPEINFHRFFQSSGQMVLEKIKCILHYFRRVCPTENNSTNVPTGVITFTRRSLDEAILPDWKSNQDCLGSTILHIDSEGKIENGVGLLQVDFANKYLGGGVLGSGCVQEEIRFIIFPELIISKLFTECLRPTETVIIVGAEQYSNHTGYSTAFKWTGNHEDMTPYDSSRRRMSHILAMDALSFRQPGQQYQEEKMLRELNKAYVGFLHELDTHEPGIATGNWGCGAFHGDPKLKALLQLMACTVNNRPLVYYTFHNIELRDELFRMHKFFIEHEIRVCDLWNVLREFHAKKLDAKELYEFTMNELKKKKNEVDLVEGKKEGGHSDGL